MRNIRQNRFFALAYNAIGIQPEPRSVGQRRSHRAETWRQAMLHGLRRWTGPATASVLVAWAVAACASSPAAQPPSPGRPSPAAAAAPAAGSPQPDRLYTHCGIDEARIGNRYFQAVRPLSDGQGNPPPGWGNPYQPGTMTLLSPATAVFRDHAGHRVLFRLRRGATAFQHLCS